MAIGPIDKSIARHIKILNENGFRTDNSCSGILSEHKDKEGFPYVYGYISFATWKVSDKYKRIIQAAENSGLNCTDMRFNGLVVRLPHELISEEDDKQKMIMWDTFLDRLSTNNRCQKKIKY